MILQCRDRALQLVWTWNDRIYLLKTVIGYCFKLSAKIRAFVRV